MRSVPERTSRAVPSIYKRIITPAHKEFSISPAWSLQNGVTLNAALSANVPVAMPFALSEGATIFQLGWYNGSSTQSGNVDIGVYDTSWNRKVSGGGTAASGTSVWQWVNVADTSIPSGRYYLVIVRDSAVTHAVAGSPSGAAIMGLFGVMDSATAAYPLPDPLTNMVSAATASRCPIGAIAFTRNPF